MHDCFECADHSLYLLTSLSPQEPSYFLSYGIFAERGLEVLPLPRRSSSDWNLTAAVLEQALQSVQQQGKRCAFVYLVPTHSNPTSHTLSLQTRKELIKVSLKALSQGIFVFVVFSREHRSC
jgi:DNA-binding transcriptional MocR family regulator